MVGEPWRMVSGPGQIEVTLDWTDPTSGPTGPAQVVYDNVEVWLYESPRPNVVAWGGLSYGSATVPSSLTNAVAVAAGGATSFALRSDGTVARWGGIFGGWLGELWPAIAATFPSDLTNVVAIAATSTAIDISPLGCHFLALRADGTVIRWDSSSLLPKTDVPSELTHVVAVAPGAGHCLALRADGTVVAWGENWNGQTNVPSGLTNAVAVAAGWSHSLALRADGTVVTWGNPDRTNVPAGLSSVVAVAAGFAHSLALCADGRIVAWGGSGGWHPEYGGTNVPPSLTNAVAVAAGYYHGLAVRADGTVVAWPPDMPATGVPSGLTNVVASAGGVYQGLALIGDGPPVVQASVSHPATTAEGFSVSLPTQSGRVYRLEYKHSLADPDWTPLPLVAGTGHAQTLTDPTATGKQRFYRVRRW
jgi:alpha-tubulin suppressor-like RCC1 family protein